MAKIIKIVCYGTTEVYPESERKSLIKEFQACIANSDGSERDRYTNIYLDLVDGQSVCRDE